MYPGVPPHLYITLCTLLPCFHIMVVTVTSLSIRAACLSTALYVHFNGFIILYTNRKYWFKIADVL